MNVPCEAKSPQDGGRKREPQRIFFFKKQPVRQSCHGNLALARVEMEGKGRGKGGEERKRGGNGEGEVPIHMMR